MDSKPRGKKVVGKTLVPRPRKPLKGKGKPFMSLDALKDPIGFKEAIKKALGPTQSSPAIHEEGKRLGKQTFKKRKSWCSSLVVFDRKEIVKTYGSLEKPSHPWRIIMRYARKLLGKTCQNKVSHRYALYKMKHADMVIAAMDGDILCGFCLVHFGSARIIVSVICSQVARADVGKKLLDKAKELGKAAGKRYLVLCALDEAVGFYLRQGLTFVLYGHPLANKDLYEAYDHTKTKDLLHDLPNYLLKKIPSRGSTCREEGDGCFLMMKRL